MVAELVRRCEESLRNLVDDYEIILVNDGSPDNSWAEICRACAASPRVKGLNLSRNFGQHMAISAGLAYSKGDWVVVMDCDLQDRPEDIPALYQKSQEGWHVVHARRAIRKEGRLKKLTGKIFHFVFKRLSGQKTDQRIGNFGIFSRKVIDTFNAMPEAARSFESLIRYMGFPSACVDIARDERAEGKSSYSLSKLLRLTFDIILSNSNKPLKMAVYGGFFMSLAAFLLALYNIIAKLSGLITIQGYTTTVFSIWFVGGAILFLIGILGLYIGKIFNQVKGRPLFIVKDELNF